MCAEQVEGDIAGEKQEIVDAKQGIVDLRKELAKLTTKCNATQVGVSSFQHSAPWCAFVNATSAPRYTRPGCCFLANGVSGDGVEVSGAD